MPGGGSADKFQIVSIADERSAEDAGGVTLDLPLLNKSHLPLQEQATSSSKAGRLSPPKPTHPFCLPSPPHPLAPTTHPFLLTLAKPPCMLIGGGLIQFAAVVDQ